MTRSNVKSSASHATPSAGGDVPASSGGAGIVQLKRELRAQGYGAGAAALAPVQRTGAGTGSSGAQQATGAATAGGAAQVGRIGGAISGAMTGQTTTRERGARAVRKAAPPEAGNAGAESSAAVTESPEGGPSGTIRARDLEERLHLLEHERQLTQDKVAQLTGEVDRWQSGVKKLETEIGDHERRIEAIEATLPYSPDPSTLQAELDDRQLKVRTLRGDLDTCSSAATAAYQELAHYQDLLRRQDVELARLREELRPGPKVRRSPGA